MSLQTKILFSIGAVLLVVLLLVTLNLMLVALADGQREAQRTTDFLTRLVADWVAGEAWLTRTDAGSNWVEVSRRLSHSQLITGWILAESSEDGGWQIRSSSDPAPSIDPESAMLREALDRRRVLVSGDRVYTRIERAQGPALAMRLSVHPLALARRDWAGGITGVLSIMALGTTLVLAVTYLLMRRLVLVPLRSLVDASGRVARGEFGVPIREIGSYDEMARLVQAFNLMMAKIAEHHRTMQGEIDRAGTRIHQTEKRLFAAQRLSTTGTLAAGIAHEINNPIGGMLNAVREIRRSEMEPARREQYLDLIEDGITRIRGIVAQVLRFGPRTLEPTVVDLREVLDRAVAFLEHRIRARAAAISVESPAPVPPVSGDALELQQAVLNLLINSLDAVEEGRGRIEVSLEHDAAASAVRMSVRDNGCGMTEEVLQRCLDPFYTTKEVGQGTGLGLSVANNIIENHGGRLDVSSQAGTGTTVTLTLPEHREHPQARPQPGFTASEDGSWKDSRRNG